MDPMNLLASAGARAPDTVQLASTMDGRVERLRARFALTDFHPWQREAIDALLDGHGRVLVVAPTGGGKSLCYQFPATELPGTTIVVSPLIALMEDQVRGLTERGIAATWLSSTVDANERRRRERELAAGRYELVYVAPERLAREDVLDMLAALRPPLVAIDEAHCISQWGHDFRPDYLRLKRVVDRLAPKHVLACTATATPLVRDEILKQLDFSPDETTVVLRGFARPNLHLAAVELENASGRRRAMSAAIKDALGAPSKPAGGAIVYTATRRVAEQMVTVVEKLGYEAAAYHAGLPNDVRADVNARFAAGKLDVVCATNAFGMGIDRPDIRCVIHVQVPGSIEAYYQEVGRAGRDGQPAHGLLMRSTGDFGLRRRLLDLKREDGPTHAARTEQQWKLFLDLMRYVEAGSCRHDFILGYFGDEQETLGGCGHCDVCERLEKLGGVERAVTDADALVVKKALAGVARNRLTAGLRAVAEMLHGKESDKLSRMGLDRLSTFGLLADHKPEWIVTLLRRLMTAGLVSITSDEFPKPYLTPLGVAVMKSEEPVRVLLPDADVGRSRSRARSSGSGSGSGRASNAEIPANVDRALFDKLRGERMDVAKEKGVPPYVICHDKTLIEIAAKKPRTLTELADVLGMGPARLSAYGTRLLAVVAGH